MGAPYLAAAVESVLFMSFQGTIHSPARTERIAVSHELIVLPFLILSTPVAL